MEKFNRILAGMALGFFWITPIIKTDVRTSGHTLVLQI